MTNTEILARNKTVGKEAFLLLINNNYDLSLLDDLAVKYDITKATIRKYAEEYAKRLTIEHPNSPESLKYKEIMEERKHKYDHEAKRNEIIAELMSLKSETIKEYALGKSSNELHYIKTVIDAFISKSDNEKQINYLKRLYNYILNLRNKEKENKVNTLSEKQLQNKEEIRVKHNEEVKKILYKYLDSSLVEIDNIRPDFTLLGCTYSRFNEKLSELASFDDEGAKLVEVYNKELNRRREEFKEKAKEISNKVLRGTIKGGRLDKYSMFDFYKETSVPFSDFFHAAIRLKNLGLVNANEISGIQHLQDRNLFEGSVMLKDEALAYHYSENGRELSPDEKTKLVNYLIDNNLPLTKPVYNGAYHDFVNGNLRFKKFE
jgi:hypothetical protein